MAGTDTAKFLECKTLTSLNYLVLHECGIEIYFDRDIF